MPADRSAAQAKDTRALIAVFIMITSLWSGVATAATFLLLTVLMTCQAFQLVKDVTPVQVADYIYDTTMEMNTMFTGTSSLGARDAIIYWGLKYQVIDSKEDLIAALKDGKIVYGAVGHGIFVKGYSTHAIILSGYDHGKTKAIDPDNMSKTNRWYSIDDIWNERSLELEDNAVGGPFMAVYK